MGNHERIEKNTKGVSMEIGALLKTFIYLISSSLLYPVLFLLFVLTVGGVVYAGRFCAEWLERLRLERVAPEEMPDRIRREPDGFFLPHRVRNYIQYLKKAQDSSSDEIVRVENLLLETRMGLARSLDGLRIVVRVAPGLGLIGTLIPMGTGLAALGQGDMSKLTSDLVIAFTTTVVGMALGIIAFFCITVKKRWVDADMKNIELATEVLARVDGEKENQLSSGQKDARMLSVQARGINNG